MSHTYKKLPSEHAVSNCAFVHDNVLFVRFTVLFVIVFVLDMVGTSTPFTLSTPVPAVTISKDILVSVPSPSAYIFGSTHVAVLPTDTQLTEEIPS